MAKEVGVTVLAEAKSGGAFVVDVREPDEYEGGHVPGAHLLPLGELASRAGELPKDQTLYVICATGKRSMMAAEWLSKAGYDAVSVGGGTAAWQQAGHPVVEGTSETTS